MNREAFYSSKAIRQQEDELPKQNLENDSGQKEALDFVENNRDLFEHFARGQVNFKPAPPGLNTFACDLKTDDLYISPRFYKERDFSDEQTTFATLHEIEHFLEKKRFLGEKGGARLFGRYLDRLQKSRAYKVMDNCVADIRENESVVAKTNKAYADIEHKMYTEDLFKETDFTKHPKHLQLPMAMLREARVPDEQCAVAPSVRAAIDEIKAIAARDGTKLTDIIKHPDTPMSSRLKIQDRYIWPKVEKLLEEDMKEDKNDEGEEERKKEEGQSGVGDPNKRFEKAYDKADEQMPHAIPVEDMQKALKKWEEAKRNPLDKADQEYAEILGVKKEDLQRYRTLAEEMRNVMNPETQQNVIDDLRDLISRIIARRRKEQMAPQYPIEEGDELVDPAELVSQVRAGNFEPKVWEAQEIRMKKGKRFGKVEITLIGDRSGSMAGTKSHEQQKAVILFMEALKEFADLAREEAVNLEKPLSIASEVYTFQASGEDARPLKEMSEDLSEKDRITVATVLESSPGPSTTDFVPLESVLAGIGAEKKRLMKEGELKKIVIVFTDGGSDDTARVRRALEGLRGAGVIVIGVGITQDGAPALTTYAPGAHLAETAEKLPRVLAETLREHLADI
jgi:von Willebrand factor type A domain